MTGNGIACDQEAYAAIKIVTPEEESGRSINFRMGERIETADVGDPQREVHVFNNWEKRIFSLQISLVLFWRGQTR